MAKFMLLYCGDVTPQEDITEEQAAEGTNRWYAWIEKHRSALSDVGTPFGASAAVGGDGVDQSTPGLGRYSIVEAESLDAAKGFADGHPFLVGVGADHAVDVYEMVPFPT